jgi:myosin heavy subunit
MAQQVTAASQGDAYWATVLKQKTDLELQLNNLASQFKSAQIANEQLCREKTSLELEISNLKREKEDVKRELEYNKKLLDSISQELVREKSDKMQVQDSFKLIKSENSILTRQLDALNSRKVDLEKRLQAMQDDKDAVEKKFNDMQTMLTEKVSQMNGLRDELDAIRQGTVSDVPEYTPSCKTSSNKGAVELPPIVVRPQQTEECLRKDAGAPYQGKVLAINKDSNFVIVDMGEDSGVKPGDTFQVYQKDRPVASVEVIQVRKSISACDIKKQTETICIGDTVR